MADIKAEYLACPIRQVVSRFGDKWSMLVLYMLHTSETGVLRFNEIRRLMTDCSQKMLSQTLKNLEQSNLVHREVYPEVPPRVEYSLTDTGKSLMPALTALIAWGKEHFNGNRLTFGQSMTLRELIQSVDSEQYRDSPLYQKLRETKPEYGSSRRIQVSWLMVK